jgi:hypothetical protein
MYNNNNINNLDPESALLDINDDDNKYGTKQRKRKSFNKFANITLLSIAFTQKKARIAFEITRFFLVALFFRWLVVKIVFDFVNDDEDHPGSNTIMTKKKEDFNIMDNKLPPPSPFPEYNNLIIVTGHSVYSGSDYMRAGEENSWFLEDYQMHAGTANALVEQIKVGVETAARDSEAILLFSGGKTRRLGGQVSESSSYWQVSRAYDWFGELSVEKRAFTEEYARDSFENLMFSMCRFYELTGKYPKKTTVVGYDFKRERFENLHAKALKIPKDSFEFVGTPEVMSFKKQFAEGEVQVRALFTKDAFGCKSPLSEKRKLRDPFAVGAPYEMRCPEMRNALSLCKRFSSTKNHINSNINPMINRLTLPWG